MKERIKARFLSTDRLDDMPDYALVGVIGIPENNEGPGKLIAKRVAFAVFILLVTVFLVYVDRDGYQDSNADDKMSLLDCFYYSTITLSTTGYGDITPVSDSARFVNTVVLTPLRVMFLIVLVGTTLSVLTEKGRETLRIQRWRNRMRNHTVVIGYGTKGRSAVAALMADDIPASEIVVVDTDRTALAVAESRGLVTIHGSATKSDVLKLAGVQRAKAIVVATNIDDTAVLVTLTARELAPNASIVASVRESENTHLLEQSGADSVVVSAETTGRLLGLATVTPTVVEMMEDLLTPDAGYSIAERLVEDHEVGSSPRHNSDIVLGVVRNGTLLRVSDPEVDAVERGDRLLYIRRIHE